MPFGIVVGVVEMVAVVLSSGLGVATKANVKRAMIKAKAI
jgi:hypothetical protein